MVFCRFRAFQATFSRFLRLLADFRQISPVVVSVGRL
ncbi:Uncharacterised protein [Vibrio cholerae]|nr:Uncharacterised protein [Vibrio cholerae]CSI38850.1 Uncharacterised protein [Vibrio cholerae]CSI55512.1 Uncharacterised protein [Vibrio cholerae]